MELQEFLATYWQLLGLVVATALVLSYLAWIKWEAVSLWFTNLKYRMPLFGKLNSLAKDESNDGRWFSAETVICEDYAVHFERYDADGDYYDRCKGYLAIMGESGRKDLSWYHYVGLFVVLVLEAWGFSYSMAGFVNLNASENTAQIIATILAIAFAVVLAFMTHRMGHQMYENSLIRQIRNSYSSDRNPDKPDNLDVVLGDQTIEKSNDEHQPAYMRRLARMKINKGCESYGFIKATIAFILIIALIITGVRVMVLKQVQAQDAMCMSGQTVTSGQSFEDMYADAADAPPTGVVEQAKAAVDEGENEVCQATKMGSWFTFGMLAMLFLVLQAFATWVAYATGFAGKESPHAWSSIRRHSTRRQYENYVRQQQDMIARLADRTLATLATKMSKALGQTTTRSDTQQLLRNAKDRTFRAYILQKGREESLRENEHEQTKVLRSMRNDEIKASRPQSAEKKAANDTSTQVEVRNIAASTEMTDAEIEAQLLAESTPAKSDEELEAELLAEARAAETSEQRRERIRQKLIAEGKLSQ